MMFVVVVYYVFGLNIIKTLIVINNYIVRRKQGGLAKVDFSSNATYLH